MPAGMIRSDSLFQLRGALRGPRADRAEPTHRPGVYGFVPVVKVQVTSVPKVVLATLATPPDTAAL